MLGELFIFMRDQERLANTDLLTASDGIILMGLVQLWLLRIV